MKPCPKVEWAGELKRDRYFIVNTNSDDEENLSVTVFNPNYSEMNFHGMVSDPSHFLFFFSFSFSSILTISVCLCLVYLMKILIKIIFFEDIKSLIE